MMRKDNNMKMIGLIGGVSWFSTMIYYDRLNRLVFQKLGGQNCAKMLLYNLNFEDILKYQISNEYQKEADVLINAAKTLENAGSDFILICSNTTNKTAKSVAESTSIPIVDIIDLTAEHVANQGLLNVGLLGTKSVMQGDYYKSRFEPYNITLHIPNSNDCDMIDDVIYNELDHGIVKSSSKDEYIRVVEYLDASGCEAVIMGCTEIPILIGQKDTEIKLIDSVQLHVNKAVELAIGS